MEGQQKLLLLNELNLKNCQKNCENSDKFIDISQLNLQFFPLSTYKTCRNIQHIYLEGNKVEKLDDNFFLAFQQLQWLDIRNNELLQIPKTIAKHPCLQVLLLEGNRLKELPVELGSVPNLRGLQLLRNPLLYPPKNVLEKGSTAVIQFLQKEWKEYEVCSENDSFNTLKSLQRISSKETLPPENVNNAEKLECSKTNYNPLTRKQESHNLKDCVKITKLVRPKLKTTMAIFKDFITEADENNQQLPLVEIIEQASENAKATSPSTMDGDENVSSHKEIKLENSPRLMVKSKLIKDIWLKKISTVLEEQQSELQRRRSKDALDKWQHDAKELQIKKWMEYLKGEASSQMPQLEMPYGVDEEHKRMISRSEIGKQEKSSNSKRRFSRSTENNCEMVTSKISAILDVLQELRKTRSARAVTPRSEKKNLSFEIKKINELQRTVMSLKEKNINLI